MGGRRTIPQLKGAMAALFAAVAIGLVSCAGASEPASTPTPAAAAVNTPTQAVEKAVPPMKSEDFWEIIERSRSASKGDVEQQAMALEEILSKLSFEQIAAFHDEFARKNQQLYTCDLWGAAYVLHGGCSDDCFEYLRSWAVAQGQDYFEAVADDPLVLGDSLLASVGDSDSGEWMQYAAADAYASASDGRSLDNDYPHILSTIAMDEPQGEPWDEEDLDQRFPDLEPLN
ncbi:hypothetical protein AUR04nite_16680 [Glutamicibacter uratoxydans]|uniref:DUF4240 domain-containing protein n=1 Tax=Glutamicibacter uratoxydans TaxID=43667 RepID=A0A4Y4DMH6_GLUUR|nr:DUF4240 domain-containing protein [Glutamicibacter uratoxydans]GED06136.1 hypothetical protein AUR04nite_16680 [Glutamicibacter uratoxydans]